MLVTSKQMILDAQRGGYAIGSFNTSDLEITKAIVRAAERQQAPVIIETSEKAISFAGLENLSDIIKNEAKKAKVPISLHLDHGSNLDLISQCLNVGYTSIMFDGSKINLTENIIYTRQAVALAHRHHLPCEGELGSIKKAGEKKTYTDPKEVYDFVKKTGVDFLAISIGSSHGIGDDEKLNIELLKEIHQKTSIPLVLHGASGVSNEDIKDAIKNGICKINIDTDIRHTYSKAIQEFSKGEEQDPRELMREVMKKIQYLVENKIILFGSAGKAK